ncbi:capsule biosynthesis protein, partial [Hoeflea sp. BAL378]|uniref:CapA family protein n=1 Tax=Hoeflea sp. BAL378 TaxID=1547437 RepID=UPI000513AE30
MISARDWNIVLAGECMIARPFSMHDDPEFLSLIDDLRESDVTYAHLEMNFGSFSELDWPSRGDWMASYMIAEPALAGEMAWAGIDMVSLAHNHSMDFGVSGMEATRRHCQAAGLVCAGTGCDLEEAREPAYFESRKGRVALISVSTGNKGHEWAGLPKASLRGRPGVNPLRVSMDYRIDAAAAAELRRMSEALGIGRTDRDGGIRLALPSGQSTRETVRFVPGDDFAIRSTLYPHDLAGNLRSIGEATHMADLVMVAHHFNIAEGPRGDEPPGFARQFAHAAIDAGADIYIGHGWHKTLGIEIYKGRPIFYGMGNFISQSEFIRRVPYDSFEAFGHDIER